MFVLASGEDPVLGGDKAIHDRDMKWMFQADGKNFFYMYILFGLCSCYEGRIYLC